jgi:hypothetical protein
MNDLSPQCVRILDCLMATEGFVDAWDLGRISLSFTRRIHEIREAGYTVELRDVWQKGQRRTAYRLVRSEVVSA